MSTPERVIDGLSVVVEPATGLATVAAERLSGLLQRTNARKGFCTVAFSGGGTPIPMFEALAGAGVDWASTEIFQVDERMVPPGHADHNFTALDRHLLSRAPVPGERVHPMPTEDADPRQAARRYEQELGRSAPGGLDIVHLGLGDDGHTASWPPGDPVTGCTTALVALAGPFRGHLRMTLTPAAVRGAAQILWLVSGSDKAEALRRLIDNDPGIPAWHARKKGSLIFADEAAAGLL